MTYEPRFDIDLEYGKQGEQYVESGLRWLFTGKGEVKRDAVATRSGNLFLECLCKGRDGKWRRSGISTTESALWAHVVGDTGVVVLIPSAPLRHLASELWRDKENRRDNPHGENPTRGVVLPLKRLIDHVSAFPFVNQDTA